VARIPEAEIERLKSEVSIVRLVEAAGIALARQGMGTAYNSNSFVSGVIQAAGGTPPQIMSFSTPGYNNPLPLPKK